MFVRLRRFLVLRRLLTLKIVQDNLVTGQDSSAVHTSIKRGKDKARDDANIDIIRMNMLLLSLPTNYILSVSKRFDISSSFHGQVPVRTYMDYYYCYIS